MEPAQTIIRKLGGPTRVSDVLGIHRTRVSSWQRPRESGGTDGRVPQTHIPALMEHAERENIPLRYEEFFSVAQPKPRRARQRRRRAA